MATFDFNSLPPGPKERRAALLAGILAHLETIQDAASKVTSLALTGALHAKGDEARHDDGDAVSRDLFEVIRDQSEGVGPHTQLRSAVIALRDGFAE
jgi:hypothetical protein